MFAPNCAVYGPAFPFFLWLLPPPPRRRYLCKCCNALMRNDCTNSRFASSSVPMLSVVVVVRAILRCRWPPATDAKVSISKRTAKMAVLRRLSAAANWWCRRPFLRWHFSPVFCRPIALFLFNGKFQRKKTTTILLSFL